MSNDSDPGSGASAAVVLERIHDPVVGIEDGVITHANAAARDAFDLPPSVDGKPAVDVLGSFWDRLASAMAETTIGTVRQVSLPESRFDAKIHADPDGTTITFDPGGDRSPEASSSDGFVWDHEVKDRAINESPVAITLTDPSLEDNPLVFANEAFQRLTGYPLSEIVGSNCRILQGPDSDPDAIAAMREAIDAEESVTVELLNYRHDGTPFWNEVTIAPVYDRSGALTHFVGFQNDVTARKEAEFEAQRRTAEVSAERAKLERVLEYVEGLFQDVSEIVTRSSSRPALEAAVCDRIVDEESVEGAWIGDRDVVTGAIDVRARVGEAPHRVPAEADHPANVAERTASTTVGTVEGETVAVAPLTYGDVRYGVLAIRIANVDIADVSDDERLVLSSLARIVANGINARETGEIIATDAVVAIEFGVGDERFSPAALSELTDCRLEYRGSTHGNSETAAPLYSATGASVNDLEDAARSLEATASEPESTPAGTVADVEPVLEWDDGCLVRLLTDGFVEWLSNRGAITSRIVAADGRAQVGIEIPRSGSVREFVDAVEARFPDAEVESVRQHDRTEPTREAFVDLLEESLTDRQLETLRRAYLTGYFEWPRPVTGEKLAGSMGVSRPTFHQHLRTAMGKLCQTLFERSDGDR